MGEKLMLPDITSLFQLHRLWSTGYEILGSPKILTDGGIFETLLLTFLQAVSYMPLKTAKFSYLWCFPNVVLFPHVCYWSSLCRCAACKQMNIARWRDWITAWLLISYSKKHYDNYGSFTSILLLRPYPKILQSASLWQSRRR